MIDDEKLRQEIADILSVSPVDLTADTQLESFGTYDSTARLSLMICLSEFGSREIGLREIRELVTYGDVTRLINSDAH